MNFWQRWLEASSNPDKFWREWHRKRREKRVAYWRRVARESLSRYNSATAMIAYYQDALDGDGGGR